MHIRKLVAPIVIAAIIVLYLTAFVFILAFINGIPLIFKVLGGIVPLLLSGVCVYVLVERIKEIRSGEEDDLGKY